MVKCVLLNPAVGPLGACGMIDGRGYNLGYVQSSPQMVEDGSISIVYLNGDRCGSTSFYSTRIIFLCDDHPVSSAAPTVVWLLFELYVKTGKQKLHLHLTRGENHPCTAFDQAV